MERLRSCGLVWGALFFAVLLGLAGCTASAPPEEPPGLQPLAPPPLPAPPSERGIAGLDSERDADARPAAPVKLPGFGTAAPPPPGRSNGATRRPRAARISPPAGQAHVRSHKAPLERLPFQDYLELAPQLEGVASWYGPGFHRKKTASGETYNQYGLTAAHLLLPMGTSLLVENLDTGAKVRVRINDRGPYKKGRVIDLSRSAAIRLGMIKKGTAPVRLTVLRWPTGMKPSLGLRAYRQFVVQVAAYPDAAKAEARRHALRKRFEQVAFRTESPRRGIFAVFAGPYDDERAARRVASRLQQSGISNFVRSYRK